MTIINKTMVPLNKYGVPCVDALSYPSRSNSSSIGEGSPGTFYIKKSNQGLYLVEAKIISSVVPPLEDCVVVWNWSFNQTTNLCDPGIVVWVHYDEGSTMYCPYVAHINATPVLKYNTEGYEGAFGNIGGTTGAYMKWTHMSNYPTDVSRLEIDVIASGNVYFMFETTDYKRYFVTISGDPLTAEPSLGWDVNQFYNGTDVDFPEGTVAWSHFGSIGEESSFSFRDVSFFQCPIVPNIFIENFTTGAYDHVWNYIGTFSSANIGTRDWITEPSWTESVTGSGGKLNTDFTYTGATNIREGVSGDPPPYDQDLFFTNQPYSYGRYQVSLPGTIDLALGAHLIVEIGIETIKQEPYTYAAPNNRAHVDVIIEAEGLYEGSWATRSAALRFNVSNSGQSGIFTGDILTYLNTTYSWAEEWRLKGVYFNYKFMLVSYPDVVGSPTPTPEMDAQIKANIDSIKISQTAPSGATTGNLIDPSSGTAVSF
jgi:hypothetical protein